MSNIKSLWKKLFMAAFAVFWSSCDSTTSASTENDCSVNGKDGSCTGTSANSSSSKKKGEPTDYSSSSGEEFGGAVALYGVIYDPGDMPIALYGPPCVLNGTNCEEEATINCYEPEEESEIAIECDNGETFDNKTAFANEARTRRHSNPNFAANCSEVTELCVDKYDPSTETVSGGCTPDITCPAKPEDDK